MAETKHEYCAYLMRLWRDDAATPWRGSLECPRTGKRQHFATIEQLVNQIKAETTEQGDDHAKSSDLRI